MAGPGRLARSLAGGDRIALLAALFVAIVVCTVAVADVRTSILDAVRGYVSGEGLWSKAQKAAVYHLTRYADSHDERDFALYREAIGVTLGDRQARLELEKPDPDPAVVRDGFLRGRIHPDDIPGMAALFGWFRDVSYMDRAIAIWAEADGLIAEVQRRADELHAEIATKHPDPARVGGLVDEIARLDARLTPLEDGFSTNLSEGARWARRWLTWATYLAAGALAVLGVLLSRRMRQAERREREGAALTRAIVDEAHDCIVTADRHGRIVEFNPAAERTFGWRREEVVGRTLAETIVPPALRDAHVAGLRRHLATGARRILGRRVEMTAVRRDGSEFPVEIALAAIERGAEPIFAAHLRDLTERRQAEQAVREAEASRRAEEALVETQRFVARVADATPNILYLVDVHDGRLLYVNRQVTRILGHPTTFPRESDLALLRSHLHPEDLAALPAAVDDWFAGVADHQVMELELRVKDAAGQWRWMHSRNIVFARDPEGGPRQVLGTAQDVTERRRADELAREHDAALAHVLRISTLGEMAASLAHELNQPLAAIVSYARGCTRRLQSGGATLEDIVPVVEQISTEALRAGEFIRHMREFIAKEEPTREPVDVNAVIETVARLVAPEARRSGVAVRQELAPSPLVAIMDRVQIEQVVLNLLRNAFDALRGQPPAARSVAIRTAPTPEGGVAIEVEDDGPGMSSEVAARIFEPFFTTKAQGMGMGLAISRSIAEAHSGRLWASPVEPHGTVFRLELPRPEEAEENQRRVAAALSHRGDRSPRARSARGSS